MDRTYLEGLGIDTSVVDQILAEHNKDIGASAVQTQQTTQPPQAQTQVVEPQGVSQEDYDRVVAELEKLRTSGMTEEERVQAEIAKAQKAEAKYRLEMSKLKVAKIFVEAGLSEEEYTPLLDNVATADEKLSVALATQIAGTLKTKTEMAEKTVREQIMKDTPSAPGAGTADEGEDDISLGAQMAESYCAKFN